MEDLPDTPMEDVTLQKNSVSSEMLHSDKVISANKKKKKRKRGNNSNALENVDLISSEMVHSDAVISPKKGKRKKKKTKRGRPVAADLKSTQEADTNSFSKVVESDSKTQEMQHDAKLGQLDDNDKGNLDKHAETTPEADVDPIYKVAENGDQACSTNVSGKMVTVPLQKKKNKRKKKKKNLNTLVRSVIMPSTSGMGDTELMQHSAEQRAPQGILLNECATKDANCSGEDSFGITDTKVNETSVSQGKVVGNMHGGKKRKRKIQGKNLNLEPKEGVISSNGLPEEQQFRRAKVNADQNAGLGRMLNGGAHKKLLVLDLNGLLADVVGCKTVSIRADGHVAGKKIFKRPFCEDFLQFCFENFIVGIWSSRREENVDKVLKVLMRWKDRSKLAFVWNQSHCTETGFQTIENFAKPLFLKELSKLWEWENRNSKFKWKVGDYDKSNTLLLDDSPYKALKNPPYTAIFPAPYQYQDQNDNALGPGGDLRVYLEGLALAEDVQKYVEQNPFGQKSITDSDPSWSFYAKVIHSRSRKQWSKPNRNKSKPSLENSVVPVSKSIAV